MSFAPRVQKDIVNKMDKMANKGLPSNQAMSVRDTIAKLDKAYNNEQTKMYRHAEKMMKAAEKGTEIETAKAQINGLFVKANGYPFLCEFSLIYAFNTIVPLTLSEEVYSVKHALS